MPKKLIFILIACFALDSDPVLGQEGLPEKRLQPALRYIANELLSQNGDTESAFQVFQDSAGSAILTLPYPISSANETLVQSITSWATKHQFKERFLVEALSCEDQKTSYSFEFQLADRKTGIPCQTRSGPEPWCAIAISLIPNDGNQTSYSDMLTTPPLNTQTERPTSTGWIWVLTIAFVGGISLYFWNIRRKKPSEQLSVGNYAFNPVRMILEIDSVQLQLTAKESELLRLLLAHKNNIVNRELLLQEVWEDEGDYIGRTLDVFISKLRKKLEQDQQVQIVNIRGVGYKLLLP